MKLPFIVSLIFVSAFELQAQTVISFSGGPNFPVGCFSSDNIDTGKSGFAKTGIALDLSVEQSLYMNFGFMSTFRYQKNYVNTKPLEVFGSITADPWKSFNASIGPYYKIDITNKLFINLFAQGGYYKTAERKLSATRPNVSEKLDETSKGSFSILTGFDIRYSLIRNLYVGLKVDYFSSRQTLTVNDNTQFSQYSYPRHYEQKMDMQSVNAQLKISYSFGDDNY